MSTILETIKSPKDIKNLTIEQMTQLCEEIRHFLVEAVSRTGGHLSSNLGTVELTVAIHKVFTLPDEDKLIWDVGHQSYTHKLLTGRKAAFSALRQKDGLSGFPRPSESAYDAFIGGHSSTSISAALGICAAKKLNHDPGKVIAVIGDGAFTGGMAYEAMNNAGKQTDNLIVILNHNEMSISKNVGAFSRYLSLIRSNPGYLRLKRGVETILDHTPLIGKRLKETLMSSKSMVKNLLYHSTFFEDFVFAYLGPVDGHDLKALIKTLTNAKHYGKPAFVHVDTVKGKGYSFAEENPGAFHGISKFEVETGTPCTSGQECYSQVMGRTLTALAAKNEKICAVTAAMKYGTGLQDFAHAYRDRFFDVGIAEQHAVTFCAGLASAGYLPVFAVYSSFLQRAYDQVIHDASIERQHIVLAVDRAGIVGEDGETHQGIFDVAFLTAIPGMTVYAPSSFSELEICLERAVTQDTGVVAVRYPRGGESEGVAACEVYQPYTLHQNGGKVLLVTYGRLYHEALAAQRALQSAGCAVDVLKLTRLAPFSEEILTCCEDYQQILFYEEGIRNGGIGEQLFSRLGQRGYTGRLRLSAIDSFVPQARVAEALAELGLDAAAMERDVKAL